MIALIQQTRSLSSLPLSVGDELTLAVSTWLDALAEIPDQLLVPSWRRATKDHDWSQAFPVMAILPAYKALLVEDREKRQKAQYAEQHRHQDGTVSCHYCDGTGYASILTYCGPWNDWRSVAYACQCEAAPISQRRPVHIGMDWGRNDHGQWVPPSADRSPRCTCLFCQNERRGRK